ncbi:MAG: PilZ domain-containing protein [bacterium]
MNNREIKEQRKYRRFPFTEDVLVDGTRLCTCTDISEGGLYLSSIQFFEERSIIRISIPFKGENLEVQARVIYCQPGIGMGVMFFELSDAQRSKIKELVKSIAKNQPDS